MGWPRFPNLLLLAVALGACDRVERSVPAQVEAGTSSAAVSVVASAEVPGPELFAVCTTCHGPEGQGTQLAPPLTGPNWIHIEGTPAEIERIIREGVADPREYPIPMPPLGGGDFDEAEVRSLASYVESLGGV